MAEVAFDVPLGKGLGDISIDEELGCLENCALEQNVR